jgi:hypothetical protein
MRKNIHSSFYLKIVTVFLSISLFTTCKTNNDDKDKVPDLNPSTNVIGYNILNKLPGIWSGAVNSTTSLGSFSNWTLDFRPISASQVSGKSELDSLNDIFLSFFIVRDGNDYKIAFRNGGSWAGKKRITYQIIDSVFESPSYSFYRFSDFVKGKTKTSYEIEFKGDSMIQRAYTNKYNSVPTAVLHIEWRSGKQNMTSTTNAISHFGFPQKKMVRDFTNAFAGRIESVWYTFDGDPYAEAEQPYVGKVAVNYSFSNSLSITPTNRVYVIITTQPLFSSTTFNTTALKSLSRFVTLFPNQTSYTFDNFHPGDYYLYALYDKDGNGLFTSGDYVSFSNKNFSVTEKQTSTVSTQIDLVIP